MQYSKEQLLELCLHCTVIAKSAGRAILESYESFSLVHDVKIKADDSPVTIADLASHNVIMQGLQQLKLSDKPFILPILSEEGSEVSPEIRRSWSNYWLVDPLDGTKDFISKNGEFCVNIALIHENRAVLGIIYAPYTDVLYYATAGNGAYKIIGNNQPIRIHSTAINSHVLKVVSSRRHNKASRYNMFLEHLRAKNLNHHTILSGSAIKFGLVAEGKADLYPRFGLTSEWDVAAGDCILREAGGKLKQMDGKEFFYNKKDSLINPEFYAYGDDTYDWSSLFE